MAEKAGTDRVTYGRNERGSQKPLSLTLQKYADALVVDVEDIDFPEWPEDYINDLEIPSEIKGSNENQFETEDGSLLNEGDIKAEEIWVMDPRVTGGIAPAPQPTEKPQPQPEPDTKSDPKAKLVQTTPTQTGKMVSPTSVELKDDVGEVEPSKDGGAGVAIFLICAGVVALAVHVLRFLFRKDAGRGEATSPSKEPIKPPEDDMLASFKG